MSNLERIVFAIWATAITALVLIHVTNQEAHAQEIRIFCIVHPNSVQHLQRCDHFPGSFQGCTQFASACDQARGGQVFWSPGYNSFLRPFMDRREYCDVPTSVAYEKLVRFRFTDPEPGEPAAWTGVEAVADIGALDCIDVDDEMAVPPNRHASSGWNCCWNCDRTDSQGIPEEVYEGAYITLSYPAQTLRWPSEAELLAAGDYAFNLDPGWAPAYQEQVDALLIIQDGSTANPYHDEHDAVGFGMKQRAAIFWAIGTSKPQAVVNAAAAVAWYESQPEIVHPWFANHQAVRYMIKRYVEDDVSWLISHGWPTSETPELNHCLDNIYNRTGPGVDWASMFMDPDVALLPTTWGAAKKRALEERWGQQ